jgi:hypothetical protein
VTIERFVFRPMLTVPLAWVVSESFERRAAGEGRRMDG